MDFKLPKSFKHKVKQSFGNVKSEMDALKKDHAELKKSANEWILYLVQENTALKERIEKQEQKQATNIIIND